MLSEPSRWDDLRPQARRMRSQPTRAERVLWQSLRRNEAEGLKFRRQHAIGSFIVDFYCVQAELVIEIDGPIHASQREADEERQAYLEGMGLTVLRFSNEEVLGTLPTVLMRIREFIQARLVHKTATPLSSQGEGMGKR
ncbi:MAG TPA: endonuclease domain-containing protein [Dehalococcoidia bacterium]|nr:endonuclease domain-containing protein [Dehalococcoidia bacterium]